MGPEVLMAASLGGLVLTTGFVLGLYARMYHKAGPHEALLVSGRGARPWVDVGSGILALPMVQRVDRLSLEVLTVTPDVQAGDKG